VAKAGDAEAMLYLGRIAIEQSDGDEAVRWIEEAIKKNDHSSSYYQWLGSAYSLKGTAANPLERMSLAASLKRAMERAVELDSTNIEARINLLHSPTVRRRRCSWRSTTSTRSATTMRFVCLKIGYGDRRTTERPSINLAESAPYRARGSIDPSGRSIVTCKCHTNGEHLPLPQPTGGWE